MNDSTPPSCQLRENSGDIEAPAFEKIAGFPFSYGAPLKEARQFATNRNPTGIVLAEGSRPDTPDALRDRTNSGSQSDREPTVLGLLLFIQPQDQVAAKIEKLARAPIQGDQ